MGARPLRAVVVGAGPAGLAPLVAASRQGRLDALLARGLALVDRDTTVGRGGIGGYAVTSDSTAATFLTAVEGHLDPRVGALADASPCVALRRAGRGAVPLDLVADLLGLVGGALARAVSGAGGRILTGHEVSSARRGRDGLWRVRAAPARGGAGVELICEALVVATGGSQPLERLLREPYAGEPLLPRYAGKLVRSDEVLRRGGAARLAERLAGVASPRIAVAGSSTSALSVVRALLSAFPGRLAPGAVTVLHRSPPRMFHPSPAAARAEGCADFGDDDVCPVTGFVFRLAGFREDARELAMGMLGLGGRPPEPRARFLPVEAEGGEPARAALRGADLVVAATGYRPNLLPLFDADGAAIALAGELGRPAVDGGCRLLDREGAPVPGAYGIGLAAGFRPSGALGGEPSFRGQANGLWLWQNDVGALIVDALLAPPAMAEAASVPPPPRPGAGSGEAAPWTR